MNLLIVESPGKTEKLQGFLGNYWMVMVSYGHVRDLPKDDLQFTPPYFTPTDVPTYFGKTCQLAAVANPITVDIQLVKAQEKHAGFWITWLTMARPRL